MAHVPPEIHRIHFRFLMELSRTLIGAKRANDPPRADRLLLLAAVTIGTLDGRPFRVQKLADYVGMPRTSVLRRLEELEAEGWLEYDQKGHVLTRTERLNAPEINAICDRMSTLIHSAHYALLEIERKENKTDQIGH